MAIEDGIGCRVALFVSGCRHHCNGCFQPQTWNFDFGQKFDKSTVQQIIEYLKPEYIDGLTLLGGEPFEPENQKELLPFLEKIHDLFPDKTIWAYSGCTFEELNDVNNAYHTEYTVPMLKLIDILVDGPFILERKNLALTFRGSDNQRVLDCQKSIAEQMPVLSVYNMRQHF